MMFSFFLSFNKAVNLFLNFAKVQDPSLKVWVSAIVITVVPPPLRFGHSLNRISHPKWSRMMG